MKAASLSAMKVLNSRPDPRQQTELSRELKPRKVTLTTVRGDYSTTVHSSVYIAAVASLTFPVRSSRLLLQFWSKFLSPPKIPPVAFVGPVVGGGYRQSFSFSSRTTSEFESTLLWQPLIIVFSQPFEKQILPFTTLSCR